MVEIKQRCHTEISKKSYAITTNLEFGMSVHNLTIGIPERKGPKYLHVFIHSITFNYKSNYFLTLKFEPVFPVDPNESRAFSTVTLRTEVQKNTKQVISHSDPISLTSFLFFVFVVSYLSPCCYLTPFSPNLKQKTFRLRSPLKSPTIQLLSFKHLK
jgi:hypothetical protein